MNAHLNSIIMDIGKVKGITYGMDRIIGDVKFTPESIDAAENFVNMFYALVDEVDRVYDDVKHLEEDSYTVDMVMAVKKIRTLKSEQ